MGACERPGGKGDDPVHAAAAACEAQEGGGEGGGEVRELEAWFAGVSE
jgi:hypothetical protein